MHRFALYRVMFDQPLFVCSIGEEKNKPKVLNATSFRGVRFEGQFAFGSVFVRAR